MQKHILCIGFLMIVYQERITIIMTYCYTVWRSIDSTRMRSKSRPANRCQSFWSREYRTAAADWWILTLFCVWHSNKFTYRYTVVRWFYYIILYSHGQQTGFDFAQPLQSLRVQNIQINVSQIRAEYTN